MTYGVVIIDKDGRFTYRYIEHLGDLSSAVESAEAELGFSKIDKVIVLDIDRHKEEFCRLIDYADSGICSDEALYGEYPDEEFL